MACRNGDGQPRKKRAAAALEDHDGMPELRKERQKKHTAAGPEV